MKMMKKKKKVSVHSAVNYKGKLLGADTPFAITESFKTLRTNLMYTASRENCPVYGITSCYQSSGKSLISANLAIAFSMMNKRVLLIDGDMRKPVQHRCFSLPNDRGFSEWLSGMSDFEDVVQTQVGYPCLHVITSGNIPPNPQELLAGENAGSVLSFLKERYDVIIVDLPPAGVVSDAVAISSLVTGYLFVVRAGEDDSDSVKRVVETMQQMNCKILGTVLNGVDLKNGEYARKRGRYSYYRRDPEGKA
ncbi:MAG: CpsD/CapB family tyrosine-protein kinase [Clostridia bacterium]|nr:CpsD/CapB family tyrosine-protein kinase [Clostridia bacterium]